MRVGDRSAFVGTANQIVDWDLKRGSQPHVNGIESGFVVAPPLPGMRCPPSDAMAICLIGHLHS